MNGGSDAGRQLGPGHGPVHADGDVRRPRHPSRRDPIADDMGARRLPWPGRSWGRDGRWMRPDGRDTAARRRRRTVTVTRGFGGSRIDGARAAPGQSALDALRRTATVDTAYGGRFVEAIDGVHGDRSAGWDWLYFINGVEADRRSGRLQRCGRATREWWDYRYWNDLIHVPVAIGAWPEPFVHGYDGQRPTAVQRDRPALRGRRRGHVAGGRRAPRHWSRRRSRSGSRRSRRRRRRSQLTSVAAAASPSTSTRGRSWSTGLPAGPRPDPRAHALIAAYQPGDATGTSAELIVAG